jgi:hypothetical protein
VKVPLAGTSAFAPGAPSITATHPNAASSLRIFISRAVHS